MKAPAASFTNLLFALIASALMAGAQPSLADNDKGHGKGQGKGHGKGNSAQRDDGRDRRFDDRHRVMVREYYTEVDRGGRCPPGLAKKNNGCMPPGQAKKWNVGRPLPRDVVYYELPPQLVVKIGVPPPGHKYVRVAGDILMIAVGTSLVVDAIQDLGRL
jgi:Ni/Co efflux regulator RcnB